MADGAISTLFNEFQKLHGLDVEHRKMLADARAALAAKDARIERLTMAVMDAIDAFRALPPACLGTANNEQMEWPVRDELIDNLCKSLSVAPTTKPQASTQTAQLAPSPKGLLDIDTYLLRERLKEIEWCNNDGLACPACGGYFADTWDHAVHVGHMPDCWIGKVLREEKTCSAPGMEKHPPRGLVLLSLEQLESIERIGVEESGTIVWWCPVCGSRGSKPHAPNCWLATKIRQAEAAKT